MDQFYLEIDREEPAAQGRASSGSDVDELNDETFGDGAIVDDWESGHYSEAAGLEGVLGHDQGGAPSGQQAQGRGINGRHSHEAGENEVVGGMGKMKLKELWPSSPEQASPLQSIWSSPELPQRPIGENVIGGPSVASLPPGSKVMTLEDLEKEMISTSPPPLTAAEPAVVKPHPPVPPPGMMPLPQHIPPGSGAPPLPPRMMHSQMRPWVQVPGRGIPPGMVPPHHIHFMRQRMAGPPILVAPGYPPPPLHPSHPHPPHMQPHMLQRMPHPPHQGHLPPAFTPPHYHQHPPHPHNQQQGEQMAAKKSRRSELLNEMKRDGSGFMTSREKEWVVKIQLLQLQSSDPANDDYYYQNFVKRKLLKANHDQESTNENDSSSPSSPSPLLTLPQLSREERNYKPIAFTGTLGKVSVSSISAPRKTIDAPLSAGGLPGEVGGGGGGGGGGKEGAVPTRDVYVKRRQTLMVIEKLYSRVLLCEELEQKALAVLTGDREERSLLLAQKDDLCSIMFSLLKVKGLQQQSSKSDDSVLLQVASLRKGKRALLRVLPLLTDADAAAVVFALVRNLASIIKKDSTDQVLPELSSDVGAVVSSLDLPTLTVLLATILQEGGSSISPPRAGGSGGGGGDGGGGGAVAPSLLLSKMAGNEFGSSLLLGLVRRGAELAGACNLASGAQKKWSVLAQKLYAQLCQCRDTAPVTKSTVIAVETLASVQN